MNYIVQILYRRKEEEFLTPLEKTVLIESGIRKFEVVPSQFSKRPTERYAKSQSVKAVLWRFS